ncbi:DUF3450 domain-containing protein [Vibrio sp. JC009]|nr:DUF3450 family protein [Vibrio sp. JC009]WED24969.1 DUF3450 domain-containing protein [Vibrio sp. JC009]
MEGLIVSQNQEQHSLDAQLTEIAQTRQSIVPLMYQMLEGLSGHVSADMPIHKDTRLARLDKLNALMTQADISDAEKYRRIYQRHQPEASQRICCNHS